MFSDTESNLPNFVTVRDAIGSLPPISAGDDIVVKDVEVSSNTLYDRLMKDEITFSEFYSQLKG